MKRILIPLCLVVGSHLANGQRSYQFDAPNRLFVEGKELFSLKEECEKLDNRLNNLEIDKAKMFSEYNLKTKEFTPLLLEKLGIEFDQEKFDKYTKE